MKTNKIWAYGSVLALAGAITVNALANILPLNGLTTGEISDQFPVFFVPAGYVFSIWGLIYLTLICFVIYQALPRQITLAALVRIRPLFVLSCLANGTWIFFWHYGLTKSSVLIMLVLLLSLTAIYLKIKSAHDLRPTQRWAIKAPFSLYLGWITVATIVNITVALYSTGWDGSGIAPEVWSVIMLCVATALTLAFVIRNRDIIYGLVVIWAFAGIAFKFQDVNIIFKAAIAVSVAHLLTIIWVFFKNRAARKVV